MQNESSGDSDSSGRSAQPQGNSQSVKTGFSITPQDRDVLQEYLEEFQEADTALRTKIIEKAMGRLYRLRSINTTFDKKDASKKVQKWFYNHYVCPKRQYIKNVYYHLHRDAVLELAKESSGKQLGDPAFLGALQDATTALWNEVSPEDQVDYVDSAREWSEKTPPKYIQSRMASSMCQQIIRDFQTYEDEDDTLKVGFNDVNSVLPDGTDFRKFCPDWKSAALWEQWAQFGQKCFAKGTSDKRPLKAKATPIPLVVDKGRFPALPTVTMSDGYKAKVVQTLLREYCTTHIRYVTRKAKQTIPWGSLVKDSSSWIEDDCSPNDFEWKDPSKIQIGEVFRLLYYWRDRQDQGIGPLMVWKMLQSVGRIISNVLEISSQMDLMKSLLTLAIIGTPMRRVRRLIGLQINHLNHLLVTYRDSNEEGGEDSPQFREPQEESDPVTLCLENVGNPASLGYNSPRMNRSLTPGPSGSHHVQQQRNEFDSHPLPIDGVRRVIKLTDKVKNMDTGRGAAKIDRRYLARKRDQ
ncbi:hypothetical protein EDB84DRAFT_1435042 [Lactarius hengduanensis]|nr:hypothetical protein EDB84DRAFT_1435042 [Lactarius hengduanensis]